MYREELRRAPVPKSPLHLRAVIPACFLALLAGKSLTSIRIDAFIQRENYRRALLLYFVP